LSNFKHSLVCSYVAFVVSKTAMIRCMTLHFGRRPALDKQCETSGAPRIRGRLAADLATSGGVRANPGRLGLVRLAATPVAATGAAAVAGERHRYRHRCRHRHRHQHMYGFRLGIGIRIGCIGIGMGLCIGIGTGMRTVMAAGTTR